MKMDGCLIWNVVLTESSVLHLDRGSCGPGQCMSRVLFAEVDSSEPWDPRLPLHGVVTNQTEVSAQFGFRIGRHS